MVAPYETEYGNEALFQQPQELGDLMGFYHAFGLAMRRPAGARRSHQLRMRISGFSRHERSLRDRASRLSNVGRDDEGGKIILTGSSRPILTHVHATTRSRRRGGVLRQTRRTMSALRVQETHRLGVRLGAANLPLRPADDDRVPMACGNGAECAPCPALVCQREPIRYEPRAASITTRV